MALDFAAFKNLRPKLEPVAVQIDGLSEPLFLHVFTMREMQKVMDVHPLALAETNEADKNDTALRVQVLYFLQGINAEITALACDELTDLFTSWQIRDIYKKALQLNGMGPSALGDALKNSERTLH
jgi:hypothetical protein